MDYGLLVRGGSLLIGSYAMQIVRCVVKGQLAGLPRGAAGRPTLASVLMSGASARPRLDMQWRRQLLSKIKVRSPCWLGLDSQQAALSCTIVLMWDHVNMLPFCA